MGKKETKICTKCRRELPATTDYFHRHRQIKSGLRPVCKDCRRTGEIRVKDGMKRCRKCHQWKPATTEYFNNKPDGLLGLNAVCKECVCGANKEWYAANREACLERFQRYYCENKERLLAQNEAYRRENLRHVLDVHNAYRARRRATDPIHRLNNAIATRLWQNLKGKKGGRSWQRITGYSIEQLRKHLEAQFLPGMTWENYGSVWHVDHIRPIASFVITGPDDPELRKCWALKNLRPLWAVENLRKGAKWNEEVLGL